MFDPVPRIRHPLLTLLCRLVVGGIFVYASIYKILDPEKFAQAIYNYRILPGSWVNVVAIILPWLELLAGIALISGIWMHGGAFITSGLMIVFETALAINLLRGIDISCGCFSSGGGRITGLYLLRDLGLLVASLQILLLGQRNYRFFPFKRNIKLANEDI